MVMFMMMLTHMHVNLQKRTDIHSFIRLMTLMLLQVREQSQWRSFRNSPTVDYILAPIGGGGLITGVSTLAKMLNPKIKVVGVEPSEAASMTAALKAGEPVELPSANTIADGTAVKEVGDKVVPYVKENVDDILLVDDDELIGAFLDMVENHKMIVENSGLLSVAALKADGHQRKESSLCIKWWKYGCYHNVLNRPARIDPERPYLLRIRTPSG